MLAVLVLAAALSAGPEAAFRAAAVDLVRTPVADRYYIRYLSLYAVPPERRAETLRALAFWINSLSLRRRIYNPVVILDAQGRPSLVRIDLRDLFWDQFSRGKLIDSVLKAGVDLGGKERQADYLDIWERLVRQDPYFRVTSPNTVGQIIPGWLDPTIETGVRLATWSRLAVIRADWFIAQVSIDNKQLYSDFLLIPPKEADLFRRVGVDAERAVRDTTVRAGANRTTIVALHNRELQLFPANGSGGLVDFLWRSLDVKSNVGDQSVYRALKGTLKRDGSEHIWNLPNGLHAYYVCDANGNQVKTAAVPIDIARDRGDTYDSQVITPYKCVSCHAPSGGIIDFADVIGRLSINHDVVGLATVASNPYLERFLRAQVEDYYDPRLPRSVRLHQEAYRDSIGECAGLTGPQLGDLALRGYNSYVWEPVTLAQALREIGRDDEPFAGIVQLHKADVAESLQLLGGDPVPRDAWEAAFGEIMQSRLYPWDPPPSIQMLIWYQMIGYGRPIGANP